MRGLGFGAGIWLVVLFHMLTASQWGCLWHSVFSWSSILMWLYTALQMVGVWLCALHALLVSLALVVCVCASAPTAPVDVLRGTRLWVTSYLLGWLNLFVAAACLFWVWMAPALLAVMDCRGYGKVIVESSV